MTDPSLPLGGVWPQLALTVAVSYHALGEDAPPLRPTASLCSFNLDTGGRGGCKIALADQGHEVLLSTTEPAAHLAATMQSDGLPNLTVSRIDPVQET